jgi:hypothetical protein
VRIAQEDHSSSRVASGAFQRVEIHLVSAVPQDQRVLDHLPSVFRDDVGEIEENGRLHDDAVARLGERVHAIANAFRTFGARRIWDGSTSHPCLSSSQPVSAGINPSGTVS